MKKILVIDDDRVSRMIVSRALELVGYQVTEADNGKIGEELYRKSPHDLIITDIFMPEKDGLTTILELRGEFPNVKIIAVSGGKGKMEGEEFLSHAADFGALETFIKPINTEKLIEAIESHLN